MMDTFAKMIEEQNKFYAEYINFDGYELSEEDYYEHDRNGNRRNFEVKYFAKRFCLVTRALNAYLKGKEADQSLIHIVESICDEFSWVLPGHKKNNPYIDLYSAITAQALCEIAHYIKLPDELHKKIHNTVEERIKKLYETKELNWESKRNNWQAVCAGCVGMVYLYEFPKSFTEVKERLLRSLKTYIDNFEEDGVCMEGIGYWEFGFSYYLCFADMMRRIEGTDIIQNPKVKKIAQFQQNVFLKNNMTVTFSDTQRQRVSYNVGLTHFLKNEYNDSIKVPPVKYRYKCCGSHDWASAFRMFLWFNENIASDDLFFEEQSGEEYYASSKWYINRKNKFAFASKGGHNEEFHNHNDLGSFIITDGKEQLIADYGSGEYTKGYFTLEERYNYLCCSSAGHSVPIIDGKNQHVGIEYRSEVLEAGNDRFAVDISKAYGIDELTGLTRGFNVSDNSVVLVDSFEFNDNKKHNIVERFVSMVEPQIVNGRVRIGPMTMCTDNRFKISKETIIGHLGERDTLHIVDFEMDSENFVCEFIFD